jgi:hypothetical protein
MAVMTSIIGEQGHGGAFRNDPRGIIRHVFSTD